MMVSVQMEVDLGDQCVMLVKHSQPVKHIRELPSELGDCIAFALEKFDRPMETLVEAIRMLETADELCKGMTAENRDLIVRRLRESADWLEKLEFDDA